MDSEEPGALRRDRDRFVVVGGLSEGDLRSGVVEQPHVEVSDGMGELEIDTDGLSGDHRELEPVVVVRADQRADRDGRRCLRRGGVIVVVLEPIVCRESIVGVPPSTEIVYRPRLP